MSSDGSITALIERLKAGDAAAVREVWELCSARLLDLARTRLPAKALGGADAEDVVLSAFASFFFGAERGQFPYVQDREDLWHLLAVITTRKAIDLVVREGRKKRDPGRKMDRPPIPTEEAFDLADVIDPRPGPELEVQLDEECRRLLDRLEDVQLRSIAVWKLEGYTSEEIAGMLGCTVRTVERKLRLIRKIWGEEVPP